MIHSIFLFYTAYCIAQTPIDATAPVSTTPAVSESVMSPTTEAFSVPQQEPDMDIGGVPISVTDMISLPTAVPGRIFSATPEPTAEPVHEAAPATPAVSAPMMESATEVFPAEFVPTLETSVDRSDILIGDLFNLKVTIIHDPAVSIVKRETGLELGQFEIKDIQPGEQKKSEDGKIQESIVYQLSTYFTGDFEIPAFDIVFRTQDGTTGSLQTQPIKIHVRALTPEESENLDIRDLKAPVALSGTSRLWIISTLIGLLIAIVILALLIWRHFKNPKQAIPAEPPLPPHEEAIRALHALRENREWIDNQEYQLFSTRLSEIMRYYLFRRWRFQALDQTTEEIMDSLHSENPGPGIESGFRDFFTDCDLMKFAKHELPEEELLNLIDNAIRLVEWTREQPAEENHQPGGSQPETTEQPEPVQPVSED